MFPFFGSSSSHKTITHNLEVVIKWDLIEQFTVELLVCNQCSEDSVPSTEYPSSLKLFVVITWFTNYLLCYYYLIHQLFVMLLLSDSPTICYVIIIWFTNYLCYYYLIHQLFGLLCYILSSTLKSDEVPGECKFISISVCMKYLNEKLVK